jgi:2,3-dihydroxybenzoate-AMP ligase
LIQHLRAQQIASFKLPERLELLDALPVSPVGKILKKDLREIVAQRIASERASFVVHNGSTASSKSER